MPESTVARVRMSNAQRRADYRTIAQHLKAQHVEVNDAAVLAHALKVAAARIRERDAAVARADALTDHGRNDPTE